ncbi:conserved hypothetical protein [Methylocella tundrae]|uniref:Stress-induced protein n=1 Tax=Methylocella tundrae TaxID=227605 RepID=A0A8B6M5E9_METTU|nr:hypothetical protein [Methylocella tundrae]VTZ25740.1 conserved hypothetical protein [Methylocella tundrae]VTZ49599.1 conserved hypothetical protein [Methylocella tundrae]
MAKEEHTRGGSHEQHVKAGEQSHKNTTDSSAQGREGGQSGSERGSGSSRGGTHEQHVKAGEQSHKGGSASGSSQGGTHEQHVKAGQQSHKNS